MRLARWRRYLGSRSDPGNPENRPEPCSELADPGAARKPAVAVDPGSDPLRIDEVFRALTDGIWSDFDRSRRPRTTSSCSIDHPPQPSARIHPPVERHGLWAAVESDGDSISFVVFLRRRKLVSCPPTPAPGKTPPQGDRQPYQQDTRVDDSQDRRHHSRRTSKNPGTGSPRFSRPTSTFVNLERSASRIGHFEVVTRAAMEDGREIEIRLVLTVFHRRLIFIFAESSLAKDAVASLRD